MEHGVYKTESISIFEYQFVSVGPRGRIVKRVRFEHFIHDCMFNMILDDMDSMGNFSDIAISNNGDYNKVFATVAISIQDFLDHVPNAHVVFSGNTVARTRLYRMTISNNLAVLKNHFQLSGLLNGSWQAFDSTKDYIAFLVQKKYQ